jgi:hypothetical protein
MNSVLAARSGTTAIGAICRLVELAVTERAPRTTGGSRTVPAHTMRPALPMYINDGTTFHVVDKRVAEDALLAGVLSSGRGFVLPAHRTARRAAERGTTRRAARRWRIGTPSSRGDDGGHNRRGRSEREIGRIWREISLMGLEISLAVDGREAKKLLEGQLVDNFWEPYAITTSSKEGSLFHTKSPGINLFAVSIAETIGVLQYGVLVAGRATERADEGTSRRHSTNQIIKGSIGRRIDSDISSMTNMRHIIVEIIQERIGIDRGQGREEEVEKSHKEIHKPSGEGLDLSKSELAAGNCSPAALLTTHCRLL